MENNVRENFNVCQELARQRDMILNVLSLSEKILQTIRGNTVPQDDCEVANENCVLDTIKINSKNLRDLESNLNEMIEKIMG